MVIFDIQVSSGLLVTDEREIWRAAQLVVKHHGEGAWFHASTRADELLDEGELGGAEVWRRILVRARETQRRRDLALGLSNLTH